MISKPVNIDANLYYAKYIDVASGDDLLIALEESRKATLKALSSVGNEYGSYAYAEGKWTVKQVLQHIIDVERIFCYRALRFARNDKTALLGFDEDFYADNDQTDTQDLATILKDFECVRNATISLFATLPENRLDTEVLASGVVMTPRILGWSMVGHTMHHLGVINTRYKK